MSTVRLHSEVVTGDHAGITFVVVAGWHWVRMIDCKLTDCKVLFEGNARGRFFFDRCDFIRGSVATLGQGVVGVKFRDCKFEQHDGVNIGHHNSDLWRFEDCDFIRAKGISVRVATSGVSIRGCDFENKFNASCRKYPHITVEPDGAYSGGLVRITGNRFGGEVGAAPNGGPPKYAVRLGPAEPVAGTMTSIIMRDNRHFHRNGGALHDSGVSAVQMTKAVKDSVLCDWVQKGFSGPVVQEDQIGGSSEHNVFDCRIEHGSSAPFSGNGNGWGVR